MIKKLILSSFVVVAFALYIFVAHRDVTEHTVTPPTATHTNQQTTTSSQPQTTTGSYKDGSYTGGVSDAFYGNVQVQATIQNGSITDVAFLQYPNDRRTSVAINTDAMPTLKQEAIHAQSAQVDVVSGATYTSESFIESLTSALAQAKQQ